MATTTSAQQILRRHSEIPDEFWELIEHYRDELVGQALSIVGNREDAEDVVQQTFCDAFHDKDKLPKSGSMGVWLRSINRCNALTQVRQRRSDSQRLTIQKQQSLADAFATGGFNIVEMRESIANAVKELTPILRSVVELRYGKNLSIKEISEHLRIPQGTVQRRLFDATRFLHSMLKKQFGSTPAASKGPSQNLSGESK